MEATLPLARVIWSHVTDRVYITVKSVNVTAARCRAYTAHTYMYTGLTRAEPG